MARNRNRQPGPILRNVIPARPTPTLGTSPALRPLTTTTPSGAGIRRTRAHGGGMPSGDGSGMSLWHRPMTLSGSLAAVALDKRWTSTVSDHG